MSYKTIHQSMTDDALVNRIAACCAQEHHDPLSDVIREVCISTDVEEAYAYAITAGNEDPGGDENVVTDGMILAHVQAFFTAQGTS